MVKVITEIFSYTEIALKKFILFLNEHLQIWISSFIISKL